MKYTHDNSDGEFSQKWSDQLSDNCGKGLIYLHAIATHLLVHFHFVRAHKETVADTR